MEHSTELCRIHSRASHTQLSDDDWCDLLTRAFRSSDESELSSVRSELERFGDSDGTGLVDRLIQNHLPKRKKQNRSLC